MYKDFVNVTPESGGAGTTPVPLLFHLIIIIMKKDFVTITPDTGGLGYSTSNR